MRTPLRRYARGDELISVDEVQLNRSRVFSFDHQGTTQCLTDDTGAVTDRFAADAWGVPVKRTGDSINRQWLRHEVAEGIVGLWGGYPG
jgi:hypothetical protein